MYESRLDFRLNNGKIKPVRDLNVCPNCGKEIVIISQDDEWIYEKCENCGLKRKRYITST